MTRYRSPGGNALARILTGQWMRNGRALCVQDRARIRVLRHRELHLLRKGVADDELSEAVGHVRRFLPCYSACLDWSWM